jgi:L-amino acid N-acyltransferase YncA
MSSKFEIRLIQESDAAAVLDIYRFYVDRTVISFEYETPTLDEYVERIKTNTTDYPWLVCLQSDKIIGFAYAGKHRYRTAYQWSPESTVYLSGEVHRKGIGRILYETLFSLLRLQGHFNVYAGVALPNEKSVGFHRGLGFQEVGIFKKVGYKHGNWHDTHWFQLHLAEHINNPPTPKKLNEVSSVTAFHDILKKANERIQHST